MQEAIMGTGIPLSFRTDESTAETLDRLVEATDRPRSWHLEQAPKTYVRAQSWQVDDIRRGIAEADAGDFADDAEIEAIFASFEEPLTAKDR
jgi:RHH-type transcriptional regulator, rel operon repressor / antitoxin RelB